jgi:vacuolar protein sorting-associated protein 13A/C
MVPALEEPPISVVGCLRKDLVRPARFYDAPVWQDTSSDNMYWQCALWQVDNACNTFIPVKSRGSPHPRQALAPVT